MRSPVAGAESWWTLKRRVLFDRTTLEPHKSATESPFLSLWESSKTLELPLSHTQNWSELNSVLLLQPPENRLHGSMITKTNVFRFKSLSWLSKLASLSIGELIRSSQWDGCTWVSLRTSSLIYSGLPAPAGSCARICEAQSTLEQGSLEEPC